MAYLFLESNRELQWQSKAYIHTTVMTCRQYTSSLLHCQRIGPFVDEHIWVTYHRKLKIIQSTILSLCEQWMRWIKIKMSSGSSWTNLISTWRKKSFWLFELIFYFLSLFITNCPVEIWSSVVILFQPWSWIFKFTKRTLHNSQSSWISKSFFTFETIQLVNISVLAK